MKKHQRSKEEGAVKLIRKANELVEARYRFDIWETRVFAKMLTLIKPDDEALRLYDIHVGDLLRDFNLQDAGDNYQAVKQAAKKLISRVIEIEKDTPEGVKWYAVPLLAGAQGFREARRGNYISVQFHPELKPYLLELKERYLQYDIRNLWGLSSVYSVRIYELLKQYERIGKRNFSLDDLRLRLAVQPEEYKLYGHFKDKIILKAQTDLREFTDISFSFDEQKEGRRVVALTFFIHANNGRGIPTPKQERPVQRAGKGGVEENQGLEDIYAQVKPWGVTESTLKSLLHKHGEERVRQGVVCTQDNQKQQKVKDNIGGFFVKAVEEGWKSTQQLKQERAAEKRRQAEETRAQALAELARWEERLEDLLTARRTDANEVIRLLTQSDPFLAAEAVNKIMNHRTFRKSLEKSTGLDLGKLQMDDWRYNKPLRDAVIAQIEVLRPESFKEVQAKFDANVLQSRKAVEGLRKKI
ncbi:MAG: RepB family plasmid replication initiator protein [Bacteroidetes bacterium]|nr:RepB family plasmid replication initiator protein [Bacteroidota bacterium]